MNLFDRLVRAFAPQTALRRELAKRGLGVLGRHAPAPRQRFMPKPKDWGFNTGDPDDARPRRIVDRRTLLDLVARDPFARKILNTLVNNAVGWGITGAPKGNQAVGRLWKDWIKVCDFYGRLDLYGLQELAVRTMFHLGEVFIVFRTARLAEGDLGIPLRLQLIDPGMLATHLTARNIVNGIEYDDDGRPARYHFRRSRAGQAWTTMETVDFAAADVVHLFAQDHVGQRHGNSAFEPIIKRLGDIDEAVEAEIVRKNIEACFVGLITPAADDAGADESFGDIEPDQGDVRFEAETLEPGMLTRLRPGEDVKFGDPKASGGLNDIVKLALMSAAAGAGVTYEHVSGDLSNVNYSSYRAGSLEFQRSIGRLQFNTIIPVCLERIWSRFQVEARERGRMPARSYEMTWTPPPFESVDPVKEANGQILLMQAGLESRRKLVNARGYDFAELMAEIAEDQQAQQALGLMFKGDPFSPAQGSGDSADFARALMDVAQRHIERTNNA